MLVVGDGLFIGHGGSVSYCNLLETKISCTTVLNSRKFSGTKTKVTGLAHDGQNLWISLQAGTLVRCDLRNRSSCEEAYKLRQGFGRRFDLTSMHGAFDAVWLGTEDARLIKCPLTSGKLNCDKTKQSFTSSSSELKIYSIFSRDGYLYIAVEANKINEVWRCKPELRYKCWSWFLLPLNTTSVLRIN